MESPRYELAILPPTTVGVVPNSQDDLVEPKTTSIDNSLYDSCIFTVRSGNTEVAITIRDADRHLPPFSTPKRPLKLFHSYSGLLYLIYTGALVVMFPPLINFVQLKYQNNILSPFETHTFLINTAIIAYTIAITISGTLFCFKAYLETSTKEQPSSLLYYIYKILKSFFCFTCVLAPLSLVLVLLIPHGFNWLVYLIILLLFVTIVTCNFSDDIKLLRKKDHVSNLGSVQTEEASLHSMVSIVEQ